MSAPGVQTKLGAYATGFLNDKYGADILIGKVDLSYFGRVELTDVLIRDHHKDSMVSVARLNTSIFSYKGVVFNRFDFSDIFLEDVTFVMKTYEGEEDNAFNIFVKKFEVSKKNKKPSGFLFTSGHVNLKNGFFELIDENKDDPEIVSYKSISGDVYELKIDGPKFSGDIRQMSFIDNNGIDVQSLSSDFSYTRQEMKLINTELKTSTSDVSTDIVFYRNGSFADFKNKVKFHADVKHSAISLSDLNKFYSEFGKDDVVYFSSEIEGTINDLQVQHLDLNSDYGLEFKGDVNVKNIGSLENGYTIDGDFDKLVSSHSQLKNMLPNMLDKSLPTFFKEFGRFKASGHTYLTEDEIKAEVQISTKIGEAIVDLEISDISEIDNAKYNGDVKIIDFDLGHLVKNPKIGNISMDAEVNGSGFKIDNMRSNIDGLIYRYEYNGYTYHNIDIDGNLQNRKFNGSIIADDENIRFDFIGLADLSKEVYEFDFKSKVEYADFKKLNLSDLDSIVVLRGDIDLNLKGNTIENLEGEINFVNASYENSIDEYCFDDFYIESEFVGEERTITVNSSEIINGVVKGKFLFRDVALLAENSVGSIYANYTPNEVSEGQYFKFDFKIYGKVVEALFPRVILGPNTIISGEVDSDTDKLKLLVKSPSVEVYGNEIDSIRVQIDNKNPFFNTQLSVAKVKSSFYEVSNLNLVNKTLNDTLYFRTTFLGGKEQLEEFNLGFYHTIDQEKNSIIGLNQSDILFKNRKWYLNKEGNNKNKVVFDNDFENFEFYEFDVVSRRQKITLLGATYGKEEKDFNVFFENVDLAGISPDIKDFNIAGLINGNINYTQTKDQIYPIANISVEDFFVNESYQGDLNVAMKGRNSLKEFDVDISVAKNGFKQFTALGFLDFTNKEPEIDIDVDFKDYKLDLLSPLGDENFTDIRGVANGSVKLYGLLMNPGMLGEISLKEAGLSFPYLNVGYSFEGESLIELNNHTFIITDLTLKDKDKGTTGALVGSISHSYFKDWKLDLELQSDNLLVLNTSASEEQLYYGQGYINGGATIKGYTDNLTIDVQGSTNQGTYFVIPISDVTTVDNSRLISFSKEVDVLDDEFQVPDELLIEQFKGLTLNFNIEVTKDAVVEMIMDPSTGSTMKGSGTGNLLIEINTKGKFNMFGNFVIDNGFYDYRFAGLANKRFEVMKGGTITWSGNPYTADLNIKAVYRVYANPKTILENVPTNRDIPVDLVASFSGELYDSKQDYDVVIPNADSDIKSELDFKINQNDNKIMHFGSLLFFGNFYNDQSSLFENTKGLGSDTAYQILSKALTGLISTGNENFKFGVDYRAADNRPQATELQTDDQVEVTFATKINEKILLDGKVGVPVGANTQSAVVGEAKVEFLLNEEGTLRSSVFNRQNQIQYTDEEEGYTQGVGLSYQFDFDNTREFLQRLGFFGGVDGDEKDVNTTEQKADSLIVEPSKVQLDSIK